MAEATGQKQLADTAIDGTQVTCPGTTLSAATAKVRIVVPSTTPEPVKLAANDLLRDLKNLMGQNAAEIAETPDTQRDSIIVSVGGYSGVTPAVAGAEGHQLGVYTTGARKHVLLRGADVRGTVYAIYMFSERILKVPPLWFWAYGNPAGYFPVGSPPTPNNSLAIPANFCRVVAPAETKYRGFFLNDTDLFNRWASMTDGTRPARLDRFFETALRLKLNVVHGLKVVEGYDPPVGGDPDNRARAAKDPFRAQSRGLIYVRDWGSNGTYEAWMERTYPNVTDLSSDIAADPMCDGGSSHLVQFWTESMNSLADEDVSNPSNPLRAVYTLDNTLWYLGVRAFVDGHSIWDDVGLESASWTARANFEIRAIQCQWDLLRNKFGAGTPKVAVHLWSDLEDLYLASGTFRDIFRPGRVLDNLVLTYANYVRTQTPAQSATQNFGSFGVETDAFTGYYQNLQFTGSGSHIADGVGPWKAAQSFKYLRGRAGTALRFGMVNVGNFREFLLSASVLADLFWDVGAYNLDSGVTEVLETYFPTKGQALKDIYRAYLDAYWHQAVTPTTEPVERHWVWEDLRQNKSMWELLADLQASNALSVPMRVGTDPNDIDQSDNNYFGIALNTAVTTETQAIYQGLSMNSDYQGAVYDWRDVLNRTGGLMQVKATLTTNPLLFQSLFETPIRALIESARANYFVAMARKRWAENNKNATVSYLMDAHDAIVKMGDELDEVEFGDFGPNTNPDEPRAWHDERYASEDKNGWDRYHLRMKIFCVLCNPPVSACEGNLEGCD